MKLKNHPIFYMGTHIIYC